MIGYIRIISTTITIIIIIIICARSSIVIIINIIPKTSIDSRTMQDVGGEPLV